MKRSNICLVRIYHLTAEIDCLVDMQMSELLVMKHAGMLHFYRDCCIGPFRNCRVIETLMLTSFVNRV